MFLSLKFKYIYILFLFSKKNMTQLNSIYFAIAHRKYFFNDFESLPNP
jgi:hypothetical protein